jgi:tellurite resistance protein
MSSSHPQRTMEKEHPRARLYYLFGATHDPHGTPWLTRLPAGLFGVPVGLFGLAGGWHRAAAHGWQFAAAIDLALVWVATATWALTLLLYLIKCMWHPYAVLREYRHPVRGPQQSLGPIATLLAVLNLGDAEQAPWLPLALFALACNAVVAARSLSQLATGRFPANAITPAIYLPIVGGCLVGAMALAFLQYTGAAAMLFGAGMAGWAILEVRVMNRLFEGPMPESARPTIGVELAPPVVAALAAAIVWPALPGDVLLLAIGVFAIPCATVLARYRWWSETPFSIGFWSFSFPLAALASVAIEACRRGNWPLWAGDAVLVVASSIICALALRTVGLLLQGRLLPAD